MHCIMQKLKKKMPRLPQFCRFDETLISSRPKNYDWDSRTIDRILSDR